MADMRIAAASKKAGSPYGMAAEVDVDGAYQEAVFTLPRIKASGFKSDTAVEDLEDEGGIITVDNGATTNDFEMTFLQEDAATKDMAIFTYRDKYLQIFKEQSVRLINGKAQYLCLPICKVISVMEDTLPGSEVVMTLRPQNVTGDLTVDVSTFTDTDFLVTPTGSLVFGTASTDHQFHQYHEQAP